jgi:hypothetical protein
MNRVIPSMLLVWVCVGLDLPGRLSAVEGISEMKKKRINLSILKGIGSDCSPFSLFITRAAVTVFPLLSLFEHEH